MTTLTQAVFAAAREAVGRDLTELITRKVRDSRV
ncbi:hypothetical protein SAMN06265373_11175 [Shimia sagamensis]|uniref:Uncharacterized protein n=1 Tax=Shimia sagamensis TaxID=1566352 RepID=A0ABY1PIV0_9RHOB|nr:hypothetical protein SAMN06265373_11175 [Shimia sagamensis]